MSQLPAPHLLSALPSTSSMPILSPAPTISASEGAGIGSESETFDIERSQMHLPPNMRTNENGLPLASFGTQYWFPEYRKDREDISQAFECRYGECTCKYKNLKNLRGHMKKKHNLSIEKAEPGRSRKSHRIRIQDDKKMNSKIMGDVEKRLRKIHHQQMEVWRQKTLSPWTEIEKNAQECEPLLKPILCSFLDSKKIEILGISEWGVGLINSQLWSSLETNDVFLRELASSRASKYANVVKQFSKNHIPQERQLFKEELLAYHKDQEDFYWYNLGWEKYEQEMLNVEESLWNMKSTSTRAKVEEKVEDYRARYPHYFRE